MYIITVQIIFSGLLGVIEFLKIYFENRVLTKPVLVGVAGLAHSITDHDIIQLNRVYHYHLFGVVLATKGSIIDNYSLLVDIT